MSSVVLDASALLALFQGEPGADLVQRRLPGALLSAVNLAEVVSKSVDNGITVEEITGTVGTLPLSVRPLDEAQAFLAGALRAATRAAGLSLGDRCCLALGLHAGLPVLTTERVWAGLGLGVEVLLIRGKA